MPDVRVDREAAGLASGLLWISEVIEEHSRTSKTIGQRCIYVSQHHPRATTVIHQFFRGSYSCIYCCISMTPSPSSISSSPYFATSSICKTSHRAGRLSHYHLPVSSHHAYLWSLTTSCGSSTLRGLLKKLAIGHTALTGAPLWLILCLTSGKLRPFLASVCGCHHYSSSLA